MKEDALNWLPRREDGSFIEPDWTMNGFLSAFDHILLRNVALSRLLAQMAHKPQKSIDLNELVENLTIGLDDFSSQEKRFIADLYSLLEEKTNGNLSAAEEKILAKFIIKYKME